MKTSHLIFFAGWFAGMVTAQITWAIIGAALGERVRAVERGDSTFVVQTQYSWGGKWYDDSIHQGFKTMDEAVREVEARRAKTNGSEGSTVSDTIEPTEEDRATADKVVQSWWTAVNVGIEGGGYDGAKIIRAHVAAEVAKATGELLKEKLRVDEIANRLLAHMDDGTHQEGGECSVCAAICCPHGEPFHFHHDGCPACCEPDAARAQQKDTP